MAVSMLETSSASLAPSPGAKRYATRTGLAMDEKHLLNLVAQAASKAISPKDLPVRIASRRHFMLSQERLRSRRS